MVNNCRETFPWAGRFSCLKQRIRAAARELDDKEEEFWMAGLLPPRLLLLLYGQNITTTSFPLPLYLICKLQYKVLLLLPSRAEMVVYHILKCLARLRISQNHPSPFFFWKSYIQWHGERKKDYFRHEYDMLLLWCCYLKSRMGHFRPTFWAGKKNQTFLSFIVCIQSWFFCLLRTTSSSLGYSGLAYRVPQILLFSFKVSPSFRQKGWMQSSISV